MTTGSNDSSPRAGRKRRKTNEPPGDMLGEQPCVTYWLRGPEFIIERIEASVGVAARIDRIGMTLRAVCPRAAQVLEPIVVRAWASGLPSLTLLPAPKDAAPRPFTCIPQRDATGQVTGMICVLAQRANAASAPTDAPEVAAQDTDTAASLDEILHHAVGKIVDTLPCDVAEISLVSQEEPAVLICEAAAGASAGLVEHRILPYGSLSRLVLTRNAPLRLFHEEIYETIGNYRGPKVIQHLNVQALLGVPITVADMAIGVIVVERLDDGAAFTSQDEAALARLATDLGITIASVRLRKDRVALQRRERALGQLLDALPAYIMETDAQHRILYMNARFTSVADYHLGEVLPFATTTPHPFWQRVDTYEAYRWCDLPAARAWQRGIDIDEVLISRVLTTGQEVAFLAKAHPVRDAGGQITRIIVVMVDITPQRQAEHAALEHATLMEAVIQGMQDGVVIYDADGIPLRYNPAYLRILGWEAAGIDPLTLTQAERGAIYDMRGADGTTLSREQWPLYQALAGADITAVPLSIQRADGERLIVSVTASLLRAPQTGALFGAVGIFRDMTEHERLEQMREEFINIASHELRTPLTSLVLANHILQIRLQRLVDSNDLLPLTHDMAVQMKRMNRLVNNMLDLTSLTGGHFSITAQLADLAQVVRETVEEQRSISKRTIILTGAAAPIMATIDATRISQVLTNLLVNALDHSPLESTVEVWVTVLRTSVRVAVRDYGTGITPEQLTQIFQRFGALPTIRPVGDAGASMSGLGFGLYLAHAIIRAHGGDLTAESDVGRGSVFQFVIPLTPSQGGA